MRPATRSTRIIVFRRRVTKQPAPPAPVLTPRDAVVGFTGDHVAITFTGAPPRHIRPMHSRALPQIVDEQGRAVPLDFATASWQVNRRTSADPPPHDDVVPRDSATLTVRYRLRGRVTRDDARRLRVLLPAGALTDDPHAASPPMTTPRVDLPVRCSSRVDAQGWFVAPGGATTITIDPAEGHDDAPAGRPVRTFAQAAARLAELPPGPHRLLIRRVAGGAPCTLDVPGEWHIRTGGTPDGPVIIGNWGTPEDEHLRPVIVCDALRVSASHAHLDGLEVRRRVGAPALGVCVTQEPGTVGVSMQDCVLVGMGNVSLGTIDRCILRDVPRDANTFCMGNAGTPRRPVIDDRAYEISDCHVIGTGAALRDDPERRGHGCYSVGDGRLDAAPASPPVRGVRVHYRGNVFLEAGRQNMFRLRAAAGGLCVHHCLQIAGGSGVVCGVDVGQRAGSDDPLPGRSSNITMRYCVNLDAGAQSGHAFAKAIGDFRDVRGLWVTDCLATQSPGQEGPALRIGIDGFTTDTLPTLIDVWLERLTLPTCGTTGAHLGGTGSGVLRRSVIGTTVWSARNEIGAVVLEPGSGWVVDDNVYAGPAYPPGGPGSPYERGEAGAARIGSLRGATADAVDLSRWRALTGQDLRSVACPAGSGFERPEEAEMERARPRAAWESAGMTLARALAARPRRAWCEELSGWSIVRWMLERWAQGPRELQ